MRGWAAAVCAAVAIWIGSGFAAGDVGAAQLPTSAREEIELLRAKLAEREARIQALQARLEVIDDEKLYLEAERLGIVQAVRQSRLPARQQRRLAIAILREAQRNGIDPLLVVAVIRCESSFNNYAVSGAGAMGLMQVMPKTGTYLASKAGFDLGRATNLFDSELNVELGTAYLADLIHRFGSVEKALVAYNAGPGLARKILAKKDARTRFMAGYPAKVVAEFKKLKEKQTSELTLRAQRKAASEG